MFNKKKHSCVFCSNKNETSKSKVFFCRDCLKIRNYIRDNGIRTLLDKLENNKVLASAPPYSNAL